MYWHVAWGDRWLFRFSRRKEHGLLSFFRCRFRKGTHKKLSVRWQIHYLWFDYWLNAATSIIWNKQRHWLDLGRSWLWCGVRTWGIPDSISVKIETNEMPNSLLKSRDEQTIVSNELDMLERIPCETKHSHPAIASQSHTPRKVEAGWLMHIMSWRQLYLGVMEGSR